LSVVAVGAGGQGQEVENALLFVQVNIRLVAQVVGPAELVGDMAVTVLLVLSLAIHDACGRKETLAQYAVKLNGVLGLLYSEFRIRADSIGVREVIIGH